MSFPLAISFSLLGSLEHHLLGRAHLPGDIPQPLVMRDVAGEFCWEGIKEHLEGQVGTGDSRGPRPRWRNALSPPLQGISGTVPTATSPEIF